MSAWRLRLRLARSFSRIRPLRWSFLVVAVGCALVTLSHVSVSAFSLSPDQTVARELGNFDFRLDLGSLGFAPGDTAVPAAALDGVRTTGQRSDVYIRTFDLRPTGMRLSGYMVFSERDWTALHGGRYRLDSGRWPNRPGEVALTPELYDQLHGRGTLGLFSGLADVQVVGRVTDTFGTSSSQVLAAPGTWSTFNSPAIKENFASVAAAAQVFWSGDAPLEAVASSIRDRVATARPDAGPDTLSQIISPANIDDRASIAAHGPTSVADKSVLVYLLPALLVPALTVTSVLFTSRRRVRSNVRVLTGVGVRPRDSVAAIITAITTGVLGALAVGVGVGCVLGIGSRSVIAHHLTQPVSPWPDIAGHAVILLVSALVPLALFATWIYRPARPHGTRERRVGAFLAGGSTAVRRTSAVIALGIAGWQLSSLSGPTGAASLAASVLIGVLLLVPDVMAGVVRRLPRDRPRLLLAKQQLAHDSGRASAAVVALTTIFALPLVFGSLLASLVATANDDLVARVAPGQIVVAQPSGSLIEPPPPRIVADVADTAGLSDPVQVYYLVSADESVTVAGAGLGTVLAVDSVADAGRLNNGALTAEQRRTLESGGLLDWTGNPAGARQLVVTDDTSGAVVSRTTPLRSADASDFQASWRGGSASALILRRTAEALELPVSASSVVFTGVSGTQAEAAGRAAQQWGFDPGFVSVHEGPKGVSAPDAWLAALTLLALLAVTVIAAVMHALGRELRRYWARLLSVGLPPRWIRGVMIAESGVLGGVSLVLALAVALVSNVVFATRVHGVVLSVPYGYIAAALVVFAVVGVGSTLLSARRLRPADRAAA